MPGVSLVPEVWARLVGTDGLLSEALAGTKTTVTYFTPVNPTRDALWLYDVDVVQADPTLPGYTSRAEVFDLHGMLGIRTPGLKPQAAVERGQTILQAVCDAMLPDMSLGVTGLLKAFLAVTKVTPAAEDEGWHCLWYFDIHCSTFI